MWTDGKEKRGGQRSVTVKMLLQDSRPL